MNISQKISIILSGIFVSFSVNAQDNQQSIHINNFITQWNNAINSKDTATLSKLYNNDDDIFFYHISLSTQECMKQKAAFYKQKKDFQQSIIAPVTFTANESGYIIHFTKASLLNGKTSTIAASLTIDTSSNNWLITAESDSLADALEAKYAATIGDRIQGDFNGDGVKETVSYQVIKNFGVEKGYLIKITFSTKQIPSITMYANRNELTLINESDIDGVPGDELTIYMPPLGGCTYDVETRGLKDGKWHNVIPGFIFPTFCDELSYTELQSLVFRKNNEYFYIDKVDNGNEEFIEVIHKVGNVQKSIK